MEFAVRAAVWVVGRAVGSVSNGLLETWAASKKLGQNFHDLKLLLLEAQARLDSAQGREDRSPALAQLLSQLGDLAYAADDVLDELDYFRIQDELDGTYETVDDAEEERGLASGLVLHARHTARAIAKKLACTCYAARSHVDDPAQEVDAKQGRCLSATAAEHVVGKRLPCCSLPSVKDDAVARQRKLPSAHAPKLMFDRVELSKKISDIIQDLKPVCDTVDRILGPLQPLGHYNNAKTQGVDLEKRPKTTPTIIEPILFGRENHLKAVADEIMDGKYCDNDLTVLPIVGPGGIGKTTFTQHIYEKVKSHFQVSVWICVSQNFNVNILAKEIAELLPPGNNERGNESDQEKIEKRIQSKQLLLVLDDIWNCPEDEWKTLLAPFRKGGTKGNMVIVTTRFPRIGENIESTNCSIKLKHLQDEDSMRLFLSCVGINSWEPDYLFLKDLGTSIVKRLKGFPLAVKTVGRLLRNQLTFDRWRAVLESKEWEHQDNDNDIMPALKLSYNYLPFHLQQCFSCCALFPEDYRFGRQELTHLWIGLGLLGAGDRYKKIEDVGHGYLNDLVDNGFFEQDGKNYNSPYVIHDLLHELATNVSSYESLRLNSSNVRSIQIPTSIRHMSVIVDDIHVKDRMTFENHKKDLSTLGKKLKARNLRTIMLFGEYHGSFYRIFCDILREAKSLRVVFLSAASYDVDDLLHNFSELVHLRYLRIKDSRYHRENLPSNITRFYHLLVLDLQYHRGQLGFLRDMRNLLKLRHFLVNNDKIHSSIFEVGKLQFLQELRRFEVKRETEGFELAQIGQLIELQGSLGIYNLEKIEAIREADKAKLANIHHLDRLVLNWNDDRCNKDSIREEDILESLRPHDNIRVLHIAGHGGATYPNWLGVDPTIRNLESLHLESVNWDILPLPGNLCMSEGKELQGPTQLGQGFHSLKTLMLSRIPTMKKWGGIGICNFLPHLQNLSISDCPNLIELPFSDFTSNQSEQSMTCFPKLERINISDCPKLLSFPPIPWAHILRHVEIKGVASGFDELYYENHEQSESRLRVKRKDAWDGVFWDLLDFNNLTELQNLEMENCPPVSLDHLKMLTCLKSLDIEHSTNILLPASNENNVQCKLLVENLRIYSCGASGRELTQLLSHFSKLSRLSIMFCQNIARLGVAEQQTTAANKAPDTLTAKQQQQAAGSSGDEEGLLLLPPQIQDLNIQGLVFSSSSFSTFPTSLKRLNLWNVEGMDTLPHPLPNLTQLTIYTCGNLRGGEVLWALLAQGRLKSLYVHKTPNFFLGRSQLDEQQDDDDVHNSSTLLLNTDDFAGILSAPICRLLSSSLTALVLSRNDEVESFTREQEEALHMLTSIQNLSIWSCKILQSLPGGLNRLPSLKAIQIGYCPAISSLASLPDSVQRLEIKRCTAISSLAGLPDSVQQLDIDSCEAIRSLDSLPNSMQELRIYKCPAIHSLPKDSLPTSLRKIDVSVCGSEELKRQCRKLQGTVPIVRTY